MKKEFIPYKQALELKELGFDEQCFGFYNSLHELETLRKEVLYDVDGGVFENWNKKNYSLSLVSAPLYQQASRWFREKYNLMMHIQRHSNNKYLACMGIQVEILCDTYEEAELACLKKLIEIVKNK